MAASRQQLAVSHHSSAAVNNKLAAAMDEKKSSKTLFNSLRATCQMALIQGSAICSTDEPTEVCETCARFFEATSQNAGGRVLKEMMALGGAASQYSPAHLDGLTKDGVLSEFLRHPELLTVFAAFPVGHLSSHMNKMAKEMARRNQMGGKIKDESIDFMAKLHLYLPQNTLEATCSLRTYCTLLSILFGPQSIIYCNVRFMLKFFEDNTTLFTILPIVSSPWQM